MVLWEDLQAKLPWMMLRLADTILIHQNFMRQHLDPHCVSNASYVSQKTERLQNIHRPLEGKILIKDARNFKASKMLIWQQKLGSNFLWPRVKLVETCQIKNAMRTCKQVVGRGEGVIQSSAAIEGCRPGPLCFLNFRGL